MDITLAVSMLGIGAMALALAAYWRIGHLQGETVRLRDDMHSLQCRLREHEEMAEHTLARLIYESKRQNAQLRFTPHMTIAQACDFDPRARVVLANLHLGGCAHCAVDENLTLAEAARSRGRDLDEILVALNALPEPEAQPKPASDRLGADPSLGIVV